MARAKPKPSSRQRKAAAKPRAKPAKPREIAPAPVAPDAERNFKPILLQRLSATRPNQVAYLEAMAKKTIVFGLGSAGTGKTFMAAGYAAREIASGRVEKLILTRPLVQCGDGLGFLPGDLMAKVSPFMMPLLDSLSAFFSTADMETLISMGRIQLTPLELMRGASPKNTIIILDECQGASRKQLEMILSRIDIGSKLICAGDENQTDLEFSHLTKVVAKLSSPSMIEGMAIVRFTRDDNMRTPMVAAVCERLGI